MRSRLKKVSKDISLSRTVRSEALGWSRVDSSLLCHLFCEVHKMLSYAITGKKVFRRDYQAPDGNYEGESDDEMEFENGEAATDVDSAAD